MGICRETGSGVRALTGVKLSGVSSTTVHSSSSSFVGSRVAASSSSFVGSGVETLAKEVEQLETASSSGEEIFIFIYSNHLNTGQVWYLNALNGSGCQLVWFSNRGLKTTKNVFHGKKYPVFECSP